ncbi:hypothetical protein M8J76_013162 [Diaphorina citri]|nr:hypothetical protein M8J76_013162 [Diaphorina citri]
MWLGGAMEALKAIAFVCDIITYPVYLFLQRPWEKKSLSSKKKAEIISKDNKSVTIRSISGPQENHIRLIRDGVDTMEKVLRYVVTRFSDQRCLGTRQILAEEDEKQPNGRIFKKYVMGDYEWRSFNQVNDEAEAFGKGLRSLGQEPRHNVVIFAETRAEWMIAAQACFKQNIPVVTIYATLGEEAIAHGINETEVNIVITTHDLLPKFRNILKLTPRVSTLIYMEDQLTSTDTTNFKQGIEIVPFKQIVKRGSESGSRYGKNIVYSSV